MGAGGASLRISRRRCTRRASLLPGRTAGDGGLGQCVDFKVGRKGWGGEGGKGGAHAGDLAPELEAALAEGLAGQEGDVCWERDDRACCLYAESGGEGEEGKAASALLDVEEVDAGVFDLML